MADENKRPVMGSPVLAMPVETQVGRDPGGTVDVGNPTGQNGHREDDTGLEVEVGGTTKPTVRAEDGAAQNVEGGDNPAAEGDTKEGDKPAEGAAEALPTFDPQNADVVAKYDGHFKKDGAWDLNNLSGDFFKNAKFNADGTVEGGLSEDTYKYLETQGISRETAKAIEAGQVARIQSERAAVFERAGGQQNYEAAVAWATQGAGYSDAQKKAFNAALDAGGPAREDAIDALMVRFRKANPNGFRAPAKANRPERTVTDAAGTGVASEGLQPYASYADYQRDLRKARAENNQELFDQVRRRGKVSKFY